MPNHKVGDRVQVKLSGGRIVEATIKGHCRYDLPQITQRRLLTKPKFLGCP
jgi:hypothetical protein